MGKNQELPYYRVRAVPGAEEGEKEMNIYKISQDEVGGYDTYDSAVVLAETGVMVASFNAG